MRIENLLKVKAEAVEVVVCDGASGRRLYCDGRIMAVADDLEPYYKASPRTENMTVKSHEMWAATESAERAPQLIDSGLFGSFERTYTRKFTGEAFETHVNERYVRCFRPDAEFHGNGAEKQIDVFEGGRLAGIIMPYKVKGDLPAIPFLEDAVLYHSCPDEDYT